MNNDINYYKKELEDNIQLVETNKNNKEALNAVINSFNKIYEDIKIYLISHKERYYGYFLMNLKLDLDVTKCLIAAVTIDTYPFTLIINPLILGKYKIKEIIYILSHEIEHLVLDHPFEEIRINPTKNQVMHKLLNYAMDASINDYLNHDIKSDLMKIPNNIVTSKTISEICHKELYLLQDYVYYYRELNSLSSDKFTYLDNLHINKENEIVTSNDFTGISDHIWTNLDDDCYVKEQIKNFVKEVFEGINEKDRGLLPDFQIAAINKVLEKSKLNWKQILKKYIGIIPIPYKKTKTRLNRRQPERYDISGRINDRTIRIVVAIDTSGSMSNKMLEYIFTEIFNILKNIKFELTIIECDAKLRRVYKTRSIKDVNMEVTGRGGTSFIPVIEYINKNNYRDALLIYFTDGFGDYKIPKPNTYRNVWVVLENTDNLSIKNPYGIVIPLDYHEK